MRAIYFPGATDGLPIPARQTPGGVTTCWQPTLRERLRLLFGGRVWFTVQVFGGVPWQDAWIER